MDVCSLREIAPIPGILCFWEERKACLSYMVCTVFDEWFPHSGVDFRSSHQGTLLQGANNEQYAADSSSSCRHAPFNQKSTGHMHMEPARPIPVLFLHFLLLQSPAILAPQCPQKSCERNSHSCTCCPWSHVHWAWRIRFTWLNFRRADNIHRAVSRT
jgi:hypothetical protein